MLRYSTGWSCRYSVYATSAPWLCFLTVLSIAASDAVPHGREELAVLALGLLDPVHEHAR